VFDVIARLGRHKAVMGVVVEGQGRPRANNVVGVITKEHITDEVVDSVRIYPR
jgi:CIC family chloride channel protein